VQHFTDAQGKKHLPGDVVELPESYLGENWLDPVKEEKKPLALPSKVEPALEVAPETVPEEPVGEKKSTKKHR